MRPVRLMVRTPPFHGGNRGSNPLRDAIYLSINVDNEKLTRNGELFCV